MKATVFGAQGFVGRHLTEYLRGAGWEVLALGRGDETWRDQALGHVFYCIGLTADFRTRPFETLEAHVSLAARLLCEASFDSFLYCSSTRVYAGCERAEETARLGVDPNDPSDLYNLSKLTGEAACLATGRASVRVARLSNVFGPGDRSDNFLSSVLREAVETGQVILRSPSGSSKDYVAIEDVVRAMERIALAGRERIYNLASGRNTTHAEILAAVQAATGCALRMEMDNPSQAFGLIVTDRLKALMDWRPSDVRDQIPDLIRGFLTDSSPSL